LNILIVERLSFKPFNATLAQDFQGSTFAESSLETLGLTSNLHRVDDDASRSFRFGLDSSPLHNSIILRPLAQWLGISWRLPALVQDYHRIGRHVVNERQA